MKHNIPSLSARSFISSLIIVFLFSSCSKEERYAEKIAGNYLCTQYCSYWYGPTVQNDTAENVTVTIEARNRQIAVKIGASTNATILSYVEGSAASTLKYGKPGGVGETSFSLSYTPSSGNIGIRSFSYSGVAAGSECDWNGHKVQ